MNEEKGERILRWYNQFKRDLPWRETRDPYNIWISEIILQQTRVDQGTDYYHRFIERFPDIETLANADEQEVLRMWQGLGYYSRARNLHFAAKHVCDHIEGKFPSTYDEIIKMKGVGPYTAAAISSIAFGERKAAVDGNVIRVISRLRGIEMLVETVGDRRMIEKLAENLMPQTDPGEFNQAMMELGATICTPMATKCTLCPVNEDCVAFRMGKVRSIPPPKKRVKQRERYFHFLFLEQDGKQYLYKRGASDIWQGLYTLPMVESVIEDSAGWDAVMSQFESLLGVKLAFLGASETIKHILTHQKIWARFYHVEIKGEIRLTKDFVIVNTSSLDNYPLPRLIEKYLEDKL